MRTNRHANGLALILTVGILTLLAAGAAGMLGLASRLRIAASVATDAVQARLLARSGLAYGAARLMEDPVPKAPASAANQPDDWTCRDGIDLPIETLRNPSYAQTEPYTDVDGNGRYDPGADTYRDLDSNTRFDSWSGRLRGSHGLADATFALRAEENSGTICVNDGYLDAQNRNGNAVPDYRDLGLRWMYVCSIISPPLALDASDGGSAVSDTFGPEGVVDRNRCLADVVDELGAVLGVRAALLSQAAPPDIPDHSNSTDPVRRAIAEAWIAFVRAGRAAAPVAAVGFTSDLGDLIVQSRPLGGYRSPEELKNVLGRDWERVRPFLRLDPIRRCSFWGGHYGFAPYIYSSGGLRSSFIACRSIVNLGTAPLPVLQALVRGVSAAAYLPYGSGSEDSAPSGTKPAYVVQPSEALRFAEAAARARPFPSWYSFFKWLNGERAVLFAGSNDQQNWKADAIELHLNPDPLETCIRYRFMGILKVGFPGIPSYSWASYDLDRGISRPDGDPRYHRFTSNCEQRQVRCWPDGFAPLTPDAIGMGPWGSYPAESLPVEAWSFRLESLGRTGSRAKSRMAAVFVPAHLATASSQAEFENLEGGQWVDDGVELAGRPSRDRTQTWPWFSRDSLPGKPPCLPTTGTVRLMDLSSGPVGGTEVFYLPCWEEGQPFKPAEFSAQWRGCLEDASGRRAFPYSHDVPYFAGGCAKCFFRWGQGPDANLGDFPAAEQGSLARWTIEAVLITDADALMIAGFRDGFPYQVSSNWYLFWLPAGYPGVNPTPDRVSAHFSMGPVLSTSYLRGVRFRPAAEPHRVAVSLGDGGIKGYVDGLPDPGLVESDYEPLATDPATPYDMTLGYSILGELDEVRLFKEEQPPGPILGRAMIPRYWEGPCPVPVPEWIDAETRARLRTVPSFTSALYRFVDSVRLTGAGWEGFVPKLIQDALTGSLGETPPLRVELLCYSTEDGSGEARIIPLPDDLWKTGGGWHPFELIGVRSLRYRAWMDASAVTDVNWETPILDSVSFAFRRGKLQSVWQGE